MAISLAADPGLAAALWIVAGGRPHRFLKHARSALRSRDQLHGNLGAVA